jgi:hypothetical protein
MVIRSCVIVKLIYAGRQDEIQYEEHSVISQFNQSINQSNTDHSVISQSIKPDGN